MPAHFYRCMHTESSSVPQITFPPVETYPTTTMMHSKLFQFPSPNSILRLAEHNWYNTPTRQLYTNLLYLPHRYNYYEFSQLYSYQFLCEFWTQKCWPTANKQAPISNPSYPAHPQSSTSHCRTPPPHQPVECITVQSKSPSVASTGYQFWNACEIINVITTSTITSNT